MLKYCSLRCLIFRPKIFRILEKIPYSNSIDENINFLTATLEDRKILVESKSDDLKIRRIKIANQALEEKLYDLEDSTAEMAMFEKYLRNYV